jgi:ribosomal protein S18 acetylase RimI-like enzyme
MMMDAMVPGLQKAGAAALQLEVLQSNGEGIRAYEKAGFTITRALVSHAGPIEAVKPADGRSPVRPIGLDELRQLTAQLDFEPSYEQRDSAIAHLQDELLMIGAFEHDRCISAAAFDPATRWIMRMVTHRDFRRQGWASSLLFEAIRQLMDSSVLKAVNIDERDGATRSLMDACGLGESIRQWEMRLEL